ncbi:MAG TPA: TetR/AcrR family transcriptional regulator C-terminal domain-containing protein [Acidimicrobiales bacterium]|nr:TetR/AcrR family transcriptional regulator C-terminal domain-containing protein [Acidimicrobiales bacterium]
MTMPPRTDEPQPARQPLSRERVLRTAVELADEQGIDAVSMRRLGQELGVDPMSLYKHVANKDDLLDGMIDLIVGEIEPTASDDGRAGWKSALRARVMAARATMLRHRWASQVLESRSAAPPAVMQHYEAVAGILRGGGFPIELVHHALHALGSRMLGFSQELFDDGAALAEGPDVLALRARGMAGDFPTLSEMMLQISHDESTVVGSGCDDQFEFTFALDLVLDGLERRRDAEEPDVAR